MENEKYPIGTTVYYSIEDYDTGQEIIYRGCISDIYFSDLKLDDKTIKLKLYTVQDGLSMQCNNFFTLEELFKIKDEYFLNKELFIKPNTNNEYVTYSRKEPRDE